MLLVIVALILFNLLLYVNFITVPLYIFVVIKLGSFFSEKPVYFVKTDLIPDMSACQDHHITCCRDYINVTGSCIRKQCYQYLN